MKEFLIAFIKADGITNMFIAVMEIGSMHTLWKAEIPLWEKFTITTIILLLIKITLKEEKH